MGDSSVFKDVIKLSFHYFNRSEGFEMNRMLVCYFSLMVLCMSFNEHNGFRNPVSSDVYFFSIWEAF